MGAVGFLDDSSRSRQRSLGLRSRRNSRPDHGRRWCSPSSSCSSETRGQRPASRSSRHPRHRLRGAASILVIVWILLLVAGMSNGVNRRDLDGLATARR